MNRLFRRLAICLVVILAAASLDLAGAMAASAKSVTVGDYIVRVVRAAGLEARLPAGAGPSAYLAVLVQAGIVNAGLARSLRLTAPITPQLSRMLTTAFGPTVPAPSFLSQTYTTTVLLGAQANALGFVDYSGSGPTVFGTSVLVEQPLQAKCPTPAIVNGKPKPCGS